MIGRGCTTNSSYSRVRWEDIQGRESSRANTPQPLAATGDSRETRFKDPKLHPLSKEDDIEHFLATFERVAATCRWPESTRLVPLLTGKARSAFVAMEGLHPGEGSHLKKIK